jgi:hypothetical protein
MGDGSAARDEKAPLHLDTRAATFDESVLAAVGSGDAGTLRDVDQDLAQELGATGAPAWAALGAAVGTVEHSEVDLRTDPYGVLYLVARWSLVWADPA